MKYKHYENYSLKDFSKIKIGGICPHFYIVYDVEAMNEIITLCNKLNYAYYVVGNGSKVLFSDGICPYVIIKNSIEYMEIKGDILCLGAGNYLPKVASELISQGYQGFAEIADIPASIGGALVMNASANGVSISDALISVDVLDGNDIRTILKQDLVFGYRYSSFRTNTLTLLGAKFRLKKGSIRNERKKHHEFLKKRMKSQPYKELSLGSTFVNLNNQSIGTIIEKAGLKGLQIGGAKVSEKHGNFIVNDGNATAKNVVFLIDIILNKLYNTNGIIPRLEIIILRW